MKPNKCFQCTEREPYWILVLVLNLAILSLSIGTSKANTPKINTLSSQDFWESTGDLPLGGGMVRVLAINSLNDYIYAGGGLNPGEISRSRDGGQTWENINIPGSTALVKSIVVNSRGDLFAGTNGDFLYRSLDSGDSWSQLSNGLTNANIINLVVNSSEEIFAGTNLGGMFKSSNNGDSWIEINNGIADSFLDRDILGLGINEQGHLFAGTNGSGIYRSTDNGDNWTKLNNGLTNLKVQSFGFGSNGVVFAGTVGEEGLYRSTNNGQSWEARGSGLPNRNVQAIQVNLDGNVFLGTGGGGVTRSQNQGETWIAINEGLQNTGVRALFIDGDAFLFAGTTGGGVFRSLEPTAEQPQSLITFSDISLLSGTNDAGASWGSAWGDYDNDGDLDLYVVNRGSEPNRLFRNDGVLQFRVVADDLAPLGSADDFCGLWGDYNNDGNLDLFTLSGSGGNYGLYQNVGDQSFVNISNIAGFVRPHGAGSYSGAVADFDNDGDLDIFVTFFGGMNRLYQNTSGMFKDVSYEWGLVEEGNSRGAEWADFDNDGDLDLYVCRGSSSQKQHDLLYRNDDSIFVNVEGSLGFSSSLYSIGADWGDYDNDGDLDIFVATSSKQPNQLYRNDNGTFVEIAGSVGLHIYDLSFSPAWVDYDNDGDLDLFVTRGQGLSNLLYENNDGSFTAVQDEVGLGLDLGLNASSSLGDFDNDGFVDIYIPSRYGNNYLFRNNTNSNNWLKIECVGTTYTNMSAIGTQVKVTAGNLIQVREITGGSGQSSMHSLEAEFGLGNHDIVDEVEVRWTDGTISSMSNISPNQTLKIEEPRKPIVLAVETSDITYSSAVVHGRVNPNGMLTQVSFEYGQTISYGQLSTAEQSPVIGDDFVDISAKLENLTPDEIYHVRLIASNSEETIHGQDLSFETLPGNTVNITIMDEEGREFTVPWLTVNGHQYIANRVGFEWEIGSIQSLEVIDRFQYPSTYFRRVKFDRWTNGMPQRFDYIVPGHNEVLSCVYKDQFYITIQSTNGGQVISSPDLSPGVWVDSGTLVRIEAVPEPGYVFREWLSVSPSGGSPKPDGSENPRYLGNPIYLIPVFERIEDALNQGLIAYYSFNGNANDLSGNGNHGTVIGAILTEDRFGNPNTAYFFDGVDDYINLENDASLKPQLPVSIAAWVKLGDYDSNVILINNFNETTYNGIVLEYVEDQDVFSPSFRDGGPVGSDSRRSKFGTTRPSLNTWHHIVGIIRGPTDMEIYLDGNNDNGYYGGSGGQLAYDEGPAYIGRARSLFFNGSIDVIRFYDRELTETEIQALYGEFTSKNNQLTVNSGSAYADEKDIVLPIELTTEVDLISLAFSLEIDGFQNSGLTVTELRAAGRTVGQIQGGGIDNSTGINVFSIADFSGSAVIGAGSGTIGEIVFDVAEIAPEANMPIRITNLNNTFDINFNDISSSIEVKDGTFTVFRFILGDIDNNRVLQALDAILIFRTATGLSPKPPDLINPNLPTNDEIADFVEQRGDFNKDGHINFLDALDLFRQATGLPPREAHITAKLAEASTDSISKNKSLSLGTVEAPVESDSVVVPIIMKTDVNIASIAFEISIEPDNSQGIGIKQIRSAGRTSGQLQEGALDSSGTSATFAVADFSGGAVILADSGIIGELILGTQEAVSMDTIEIYISNLNNVFDTNLNDITDSIVVSNGMLHLYQLGSMSLNFDSLEFETFVGEDPMPGTKDAFLTNIGNVTIHWNASHDAGDWLNISPFSGLLLPGETDTLRVTVFSIGVVAENHAIITVSSAEASDSQKRIHVTFNEQNPVGILEDESGMPNEYRLFSNYPNPFNPQTTIKYSLPVGSPVTLEIFNLNGQLIAVLVDEFQPAGIYHTRWRGLDNKGNPTPSGIYVLRMKSNAFIGTTKILLLK